MAENISRKEFEASLITKAWKDPAFKQELISNPKAIYTKELGQQLPEQLQVQVLEEDANNLYLVIPASMQVTEELSDEALQAIAGGRGFIVIQPGPGGPYLVYSDQ